VKNIRREEKKKKCKKIIKSLGEDGLKGYETKPRKAKRRTLGENKQRYLC
jgi:hypothetical protein